MDLEEIKQDFRHGGTKWSMISSERVEWLITEVERLRTELEDQKQYGREYIQQTDEHVEQLMAELADLRGKITQKHCPSCRCPNLGD